MAAQTRWVLVPRLDDCFEEPVTDVAILEAFQKLGYDRPTQEQAQAVRSFVLGSDVFVMPNWTGSGKSLCYASLLYIFWQFAVVCWREGCSPLHCCCCLLSSLMLAWLCLCNNYILLERRNNYIPLAQESRFILPDGFYVGISGWSRDYTFPLMSML